MAADDVFKLEVVPELEQAGLNEFSKKIGDSLKISRLPGWVEKQFLPGKGGAQTGGGRGAVLGTMGERLAVDFAKGLATSKQALEFGAKWTQQLGGGIAGGALGKYGGMATSPMAGAISGLGGGLGGVAGSLGGFAEQLAAPVNKITGQFGAAADVMGKFVSKANPGVMEQFNIAMEDTEAVLGQRLAPVMEIVTEGLRLFGDILNTILPTSGEFKDALSPISDALKSFRDAIAPVAEFVRDVLVVALKAFGVALKIVLLPFNLLARLLAKLFGGGEATAKLRTSQGAAVRGASFGGYEESIKRIQAAGMMAGMGERKEKYEGPLEEIVTALDTISGFVEEIANILSAPSKAAEAVRKQFSNMEKQEKAFDELAKGGGLRGTIPSWMPGKEEIINRARAQLERAGRVGGQFGFELNKERAEELLEGRSTLKQAAQEGGSIWRWAEAASQRGVDGHPGGGRF